MTVVFSFYEFFAGGGMARLGLGNAWRCLFANDFDRAKADVYRRYFRDGALSNTDIRQLTTADLPGRADLVWGSFPCQDLSLAGMGAGLNGERSGTFWAFMRLMEQLRRERRLPAVIAVENVVGALYSNGGADFSAIIEAFSGLDMIVGAMVIDAALFLPQSRPRLFVVAARKDIAMTIMRPDPSSLWHPRALVLAFHRLPGDLAQRWAWWDMPAPPPREIVFADVIEDCPSDVAWHSPFETQRLIGMMSPVNRAKVEAAMLKSRATGRRIVGAIYKRTRRDEAGNKVQRAEVRFDDVAGCLRTPAGGSSRQIILVAERGKLRSRLLSGREAARLMGLPEDYPLPDRYNAAYHLIGDGVAVPVVRHLAQHLIEPLCLAAKQNTLAA